MRQHQLHQLFFCLHTCIRWNSSSDKEDAILNRSRDRFFLALVASPVVLQVLAFTKRSFSASSTRPQGVCVCICVWWGVGAEGVGDCELCHMDYFLGFRILNFTSFGGLGKKVAILGKGKGGGGGGGRGAVLALCRYFLWSLSKLTIFICGSWGGGYYKNRG